MYPRYFGGLNLVLIGMIASSKEDILFDRAMKGKRILADEADFTQPWFMSQLLNRYSINCDSTAAG